MERGDTRIFHQWSEEFLASGKQSPIIGAWKRPLFVGRWEHSTDEDEMVFNIQTSTLFIDLRIPRSKPAHKWEIMGKQLLHNGATSRQILERFSDNDLCLFARQHIFGGFSAMSIENDTKLPLCTRHHCMDWNYVTGKPRPRPNKWYIDGKKMPNSKCKSFNVWKEWSYAKDENGQCYYHELWERLLGDERGNGLRLALRKRRNNDDTVDGIIVAIGDHFNYMIGRNLQDELHTYPNANNSVELVDFAIVNGDRDTAISYLLLDGGHGTISSGWIVDCAIQPWKHGTSLISCIKNDRNLVEIKVRDNGLDYRTWDVILGDSIWDVYETSIHSATELKSLLLTSLHLDSML